MYDFTFTPSPTTPERRAELRAALPTRSGAWRTKSNRIRGGMR